MKSHKLTRATTHDYLPHWVIYWFCFVFYLHLWHWSQMMFVALLFFVVIKLQYMNFQSNDWSMKWLISFSDGKQIHWWESVSFKKDSLFSTGKQQGSRVKGHMGKKGWGGGFGVSCYCWIRRMDWIWGVWQWEPNSLKCLYSPQWRSHSMIYWYPR